MSDKRINIRVTVAWRGAIMLGPKEYFFIRVIDISEGGLGILSERNIPIGAKLTIALQIPVPDFKKPPVQAIVQGTVTHSVFNRDGCKLGVQLTQIDPENKSLIRHWVKRT